MMQNRKQTNNPKQGNEPNISQPKTRPARHLLMLRWSTLKGSVLTRTPCPFHSVPRCRYGAVIAALEEGMLQARETRYFQTIGLKVPSSHHVILVHLWGAPKKRTTEELQAHISLQTRGGPDAIQIGEIKV